MLRPKKLPFQRKNKRINFEDEVGGDVVDWLRANEVGDEIDEVSDNDDEGVDDGQNDVLQCEDDIDSVLENRFGKHMMNENEDNDDSGDELWKDDNIPSPITSDDEEDEEIGRHDHEVTEIDDEILALGKSFASSSEFKQALLRYSLKTCYDVKLYMSTQKKLGAVCSYTELVCPWRVYCSYEKSIHKMQIKVFENKHICIRTGYTKLLNVSTIAQLFEERLRLNPKITAVEMAAEIKRAYNLNVTADQCRKAKSKLSRARRKTHNEHFARIWDYEAEIHKTNEGTIVDIETIPGASPKCLQWFNRMYLCFEAQRVSWKTYCRPIIGLDGDFLKWDIKGQLLAAVGRDGDNRIVPIAWAIVEIENDYNWDWFVNHLKRDLGLGEGAGFTFISDKQKGLVKAVHNQLPQAEHRMCARHILANWKRENHDIELERIFWKIARSYTKGDYDANMTALMQCNQGAYESLLKTNPPQWSRAFFKVGSFCNDNLNNLCESFNKTIREARKKLLLDLLEDIRRQCMVRTAKSSIIASKVQTRFTKTAHAQIEASIQKSRECIRFMSTGDKHEVDFHGCSYRVEMRLRTCGCGKWQLNGISCEHAACVITGKKQKIEDFVSEFFTTKNWQNTYEHGIEPVQGMKLWPKMNKLHILPPPNRLGAPGRPSNYARRKGMFESSSSKNSKTKLNREHRVMTCSNCKEENHNKTSCPNPKLDPKPKRPRGRPKKNLDRRLVGGSQGGGSSQIGFQFNGSQFGEESQV